MASTDTQHKVFKLKTNGVPWDGGEKLWKYLETYFDSSFLSSEQEAHSPGPAELPDVVHVYLYQTQYMASNI